MITNIRITVLNLCVCEVGLLKQLKINGYIDPVCAGDSLKNFNKPVDCNKMILATNYLVMTLIKFYNNYSELNI